MKYNFYKFNSVLINFCFKINEIKNFTQQNPNVTSGSTMKLEMHSYDLYKNYTNKIKNFYYENYYFQGIADLIFARIYLKKIESNKFSEVSSLTEKCLNHYINSLKILNDTLGSKNIFIGNLNLEIGRFLNSLSNQQLKSISFYTNSYKIYYEHKEEFWEIFKIILIDLFRLNSQMGFFQVALKYGMEYIHEYEKFERLESIKKLSFEYKEIAFNSLLTAEHLNKYDKGLEICKKIYEKKIFNYTVDAQKPDYGILFENYMKHRTDMELNRIKFFGKYLKFVIKEYSDEKLKNFYEWIYYCKNVMFEDAKENKNNNINSEARMNMIITELEGSENKDFKNYFNLQLNNFINSQINTIYSNDDNDFSKANNQEKTEILKHIYLIYKDELLN